MKRVLIIEAQIKQYRVPFYGRLHALLFEAGVDLRVAYSAPSRLEANKKDTCDLPPEYGVKVQAYWFLGEKVVFQSVLREILRADLVIVDQGNKFVWNHILLPLSRVGLRRLAFWGLGENRQAGQVWLSEWYRRKTLKWVSWWFAYTNGTARYLVANGVPASKITAVQNAVDTSQIRNHVQSFSVEQKGLIRSRLGIPASAPTGIFCGMLDKVKSVPFLLDSARLIKQQLPEFHLLLVGGGPEEATIHALVQGTPWIHFMGPQFGKEKADLIAISDVCLLPGRVGLVILDAFAGGVPLLSTRLSIHGPEIEYLEESVNGRLSKPEVPAFAEMAISVLSDYSQLNRLRLGAQEAGSKFTVENMAANFSDGIRKCLGIDAALLQRDHLGQAAAVKTATSLVSEETT